MGIMARVLFHCDELFSPISLKAKFTCCIFIGLLEFLARDTLLDGREIPGGCVKLKLKHPANPVA
jgi:hypothetical protein